VTEPATARSGAPPQVAIPAFAAANDVFCTTLKISVRALGVQGAAIFNRRLLESGRFQTALLGFPRYPRTNNHARAFKLLGMTRLPQFVAFACSRESHPRYREAMASDDRKNLDPTPIVGAATDIAPLGGPKPPHERTADEEAGSIDWESLAASDRFKKLLKAKRRFIVPAMIFFIVYYFALPVLIGYARPFMEKRVLGPVNLAYLFALSQFFMAWIIAALYVRAAARFDKMAAAVVKQSDRGGEQ
jgi:uncharacterized membrane protein (DUF485 family)